MFVRERFFIFLIPLFLALPFLNRAYFVDDNYFVEIAQWLAQHPERPYDFTADDAGLDNHGWEKDGFVRMVNPLMHHYIMAGFIKMGVGREWVLRLLFLLLSCVSGLFIFELARRLTYHPFWSTALVLVTPAFFLSSYSLLIDSTLGFFFFGALYFFMRGIERDSLVSFGLSGLFMAAAVLTKYTGLFILPLTAAWWFLRRKKTRRLWPVLVAWVLPGVALILFGVWTKALYGRPHIFAASDRMVTGWSNVKIFMLAVFFSGATIVPLVAWLRGGRAVRLLMGLLGVILAGFLSSPRGGFSLLQASFLSLWTMTTVYFFIVALGAMRQWENPKDLFLVLWSGGFLLFMGKVMGWVAARYFIVVLPGLVFLAVRFLDWQNLKKAGLYVRGLTFGVGVLSLLLAYADYKQAAPARDIGPRLVAFGEPQKGTRYYLGDSFTMSYLKKYGWTPAFPSTTFKPGDWVLSKEVTMPQNWFFHRGLALGLRGEWVYPTSFPIRVMDNKASAGFYASLWGSLPFSFSREPWERFRLFQIMETPS